MSRLCSVLLPLLAALGNVDRTLAGIAQSRPTGVATASFPINAPHIPHSVTYVQPHAVQHGPVWQPAPLPEHMAEMKKAWDRENDDEVSEENSNGHRRQLESKEKSGGGGGSKVVKVKFSEAQTAPGLSGDSYHNTFCQDTNHEACAVILSVTDLRARPDLSMPPYLSPLYDWAGALKNQIWYSMSSFPYVIRSSTFGGKHGEFFDDVFKMPNDIRKVKVQKITLYGGKSRLTGIEFHYKDFSILHGTQHGNPKELSLSGNDYIASATFSSCKKNHHSRICSAAFYSNRGKDVSLGDIRPKNVTYIVPSGYEIKALFGREGSRVDLVGLTAIQTN